MDWLAAYSPMQVHWQEQWIAIPYQGLITVLQGLQTSQPQQLLLHIDSVDRPDASVPDQSTLPPAIQSLLDG